MRELLGLYRARADRSFYYSSYGGDRSIELSAVDSSRLWPLLDEAEKAGLQLVYGRKLGALERYREAELCLDITRDVMQMKAEGKPLAAIRAAIDAKYLKFGTPTPTPR